jgi:hypothetical protein
MEDLLEARIHLWLVPFFEDLIDLCVEGNE